MFRIQFALVPAAILLGIHRGGIALGMIGGEESPCSLSVSTTVGYFLSLAFF